MFTIGVGAPVGVILVLRLAILTGIVKVDVFLFIGKLIKKLVFTGVLLFTLTDLFSVSWVKSAKYVPNVF